MRCFLLFSLLVSLLAPFAAAQQTPDTGAPLFRVESRLVLLDAIVADRKTGAQLTTLEARDFLLDEDGAPQKIQSFSRDSLPLSIVLLFDLTDTVRPSLKALAASALVALDGLKPSDEVAVMTFSSSTQLLQPFTRDHAAIAAAIRKAAEGKSREATFLDEDVWEAADLARRSTSPGSRRVLVFFTDGTTNRVTSLSRKISKSAPALLHTRQQALNRLFADDVSVAALIDRSHLTQAVLATDAVNPFAYLFSGNPFSNDFARYARQTGGPVLASNNREAAEKLAALIELIRARYTFSYTPSAPRPEGTFCRLHLRFSPEALARHPELRQSRYELRARLGYFR